MRACNSNEGIKVVGGWLSPLSRAHVVNILPVHSKELGCCLWAKALGRQPLEMEEIA